MAATVREREADPISLYLDLAPDELVDLEVAAAAAIEWARGIKAAALVIDDTFEYRVSLIAAEQGSSKWLARVERSKANQTAERIKRGWENVPLILRGTIALAVAIPISAVPAYKWWTGDDGFSAKQIEQMRELGVQTGEHPTVKAHRHEIYKTVQRDTKIKGVGSGLASGPDWKPSETIPANQFAEADGLFEPKPEIGEERVLTPVLDVVLVAPHLENTPRAWVFKQEGIPGTISATMRDKRFLSALQRSAVRESFRAEIPMRIRLEIKQQRIDEEWKVKRRGRSVVEVISPQVE